MRRRRWAWLAAGLLLLAVLALLAGYLWCSRPPGRGRECRLTVESGWGVRRIAEALADSGLVRCPVYVLYRYSALQASPPLQAGTYALDDGMTADSILLTMVRGDVVPTPTSWLTLTPGLTLPRSLDLVSAQLGLSRAELDSLASDSAFLRELGVPGLEGYLFPETYEMADSLKAPEVLARVVETGMRRWPDALRGDSCPNGLSAEETVVLASIVEREAAVDGERPVIAGVFLSRLRRGMRLESCATVQYALGEVRERLLYSDLSVESPYNTYRVSGLPPGPICSPGLPSIEAACSPDTAGGYLYFVSRGDGSGTHLFAATHAGHMANRRAVSRGSAD